MRSPGGQTALTKETEDYIVLNLNTCAEWGYPLDPLDVAFFRPMKVAWRQILQKWKKTDGRSLSCVPKGCFPRMLKLLMDQININSENNIRAGFRKTGISPLNPNEVLARLPEEAQNDEKAKEAIDK
uniref:Uncharacterized protein n=1 Tax=Heliothis virescens TaxID=7102 RepID=A0A2A4JC07_HELVI